MTLEEYKEGVVAQLKEDKLKQQVVAEKTGSTGDEASADADAAGSDDASADSGDAAEDEVDEDAIFNEYLEELMQSYNATVTACPEGLSYDPQTLAAAQEAGAAEDGDAAAASDEDAATEE